MPQFGDNSQSNQPLDDDNQSPFQISDDVPAFIDMDDESFIKAIRKLMSGKDRAGLLR